MRHILLFVVLVCLFQTTQAQEWTPVLTTQEWSPIAGMHFTESGSGVAIRYNSNILVTSNGGSAWQTANINGTYISHLVFAPNSDTGYCYFSYMNSVLYRTTNKGATWSAVGTGITSRVYKFVFTDGQVGYAATYDGLYKTTDAGAHWNRNPYFPSSSAADVFDVCFSSKQKGFLLAHPTGSTQATLHVTSDAGASWDTLYQTGSLTVNNIYFSDEAIGYMIDGNELFRTDNGGANWQIQHQAAANVSLRAIGFNQAGIGLVAGYKEGSNRGVYLLETIDNGLQWTEVSTATIDSGYAPLEVQVLSEKAYVNTGNAIYSLAMQHTGMNGGPTSLPEHFVLSQNFPNPFNPVTRINFSVTQSTWVKLRVFDSAGKEIAILVNGVKMAGEHSVDFNALKLPSGMYFYTMQAGDFTETKKMILVK